MNRAKQFPVIWTVLVGVWIRTALYLTKNWDWERLITWWECLGALPVVSGLCDPVVAQCLCRNVASLTLWAAFLWQTHVWSALSKSTGTWKYLAFLPDMKKELEWRTHGEGDEEDLKNYMFMNVYSYISMEAFQSKCLKCCQKQNVNQKMLGFFASWLNLNQEVSDS